MRHNNNGQNNKKYFNLPTKNPSDIQSPLRKRLQRKRFDRPRSAQIGQKGRFQKPQNISKRQIDIFGNTINNKSNFQSSQIVGNKKPIFNCEIKNQINQIYSTKNPVHLEKNNSNLNNKKYISKSNQNIILPSKKYPNSNRNNISNKSLSNIRNEFTSKKNINDDNLSISNLSKYSKYSKYSTTSRRHQILRPVNINDRGHLLELYNKEKNLNQSNLQMVDKFILEMENTQNSISNKILDNYKKRIFQIWGSYIIDRKKINDLKVNQQKLAQGVMVINNVVLDFFKVNCESFIENIKLNIFENIFKNIEKKKK